MLNPVIMLDRLTVSAKGVLSSKMVPFINSSIFILSLKFDKGHTTFIRFEIIVNTNNLNI